MAILFSLYMLFFSLFWLTIFILLFVDIIKFMHGSRALDQAPVLSPCKGFMLFARKAQY